jgi:hypothetical protein
MFEDCANGLEVVEASGEALDGGVVGSGGCGEKGEAYVVVSMGCPRKLVPSRIRLTPLCVRVEGPLRKSWAAASVRRCCVLRR